MDDKKDKNASSEKPNKPNKPGKGDKQKFSVNTILTKLLAGLKNLLGEFRKIIWPDRKALTKHTVNVVITSLAVGIVIVAMDFVFSSGYKLLINTFR